MRERFRDTPIQPLAGYGSDSTETTPFETVYSGYRRLPVSPGTGKIGVLLFPQYLPTNDLIYERRVDPTVVTGNGEQIELVNESWPRAQRPPLVNFGGNRVGVVGQTLAFDATESQFDEDVLPTTYQWRLDGRVIGTKSTLYHTFSQPGLYQLACTIQNTTSRRWVRILAEWGESDIDVTSIGSLSGSVESGWQISLSARDTIGVNDLQPYQGIMLYVYDTLDQSWRRQYNINQRALNRRMKSTAELPPDPLWQAVYVGWKEGEESYHVYTEEERNPNALLADPWPAVDFHLDAYLQAQSRYGAPANLGRALAAELSYGNKTHPFGRTRFSETGAAHVTAGMLALAEAYRTCGSWKRAIKRFVDGACGNDDTLGWNTTAGRVFDRWAFLDEVGGVGGAVIAERSGTLLDLGRLRRIPTPGHVLFSGYVDSLGISETANTTTIELKIVNSAEMLNKMYQRVETFWESGVHATSGGTVMGGPPMRAATCVHHLLSTHTNFAEWHDVILDWSGPRFWATTAPEGTTWNAIQGWAGNDYAWAYADRYGQLRYQTRPQYKGSQWYAEAIKQAIRIDSEHVLEMQVQELRMLKRTAYARLCGNSRGGNCEICGEFPCGGPPANSPGEWVIKRGLQYDDYRTLCRFAAYDFAYQNRSFDLQVAMPWRHDLDLGDLVFFPFNDPLGRFAWNIAAPPVFVIKGITHQYDVPSARWITTVQAEQLTYGIACDCDNQTCPTTEDDGLCNGDIGCDVTIRPSTWKVETVTVSDGETIVPDVVSRPGQVTTYTGTTTQTATVYGEATRTRRASAVASKRETVEGTIPLMQPRMQVTTTTTRSPIGQATSRTFTMSVPYFTVRAKGPIGGAVKLQFKVRAKAARRAYVHLFYASTTAPVTAETDAYEDGQQVLVKTANAPLRDGPDPASATTRFTLPKDLLLTVTGKPVTSGTATLYPVVVDIGDFQVNDRALTARAEILVRAQAGLASGFIGTLNVGRVVTVLQTVTIVDDLAWYRVTGDGVTGWVVRDDLTYVTGWVNVTDLIGEQGAGQENPIADAQLNVPADLRQKIDAFPAIRAASNQRYHYERIATIEQYDYKLRDTRTNEYVDTLTLNTLIQTKEDNVTYYVGMVVSSEYGGQSWGPVSGYPVTTSDGWVNASTFSSQYGVCECSHLQIADLPLLVQQAIASMQPIPALEWDRLRTTLCAIYPPRNCLVGNTVDNTTYAATVNQLRGIDLPSGADLVVIDSVAQAVGASASLEVVPGCRDCFDPSPSGQNDTGNGYGPRPTIFLLAGHASVNDEGDPGERALNIPLAQAYKNAFVQAGFPVYWWQEVDGDSNPTMSPGNHQTVAAGVAALMAQTSGQLILLDLHHEQTPGAPGVFAIVPDAEPDDTRAQNQDDMNLARTLAKNLSLATGLIMRTIGVVEPGVMSEKQTGVGAQGYRLATLSATKSVRERAVRLVVEHGNMLTADINVIRGAGFADRCALAAVNAVNELYPATATVTGCPNWPTLALIEKELGTTRNGRTSPLKPFAADFLRWGAQYGINPAFVLALCFSESQYGTDGSLSPNANNYGGHRYNAQIATCGDYPKGSGTWSAYCKPIEGAEALFKFLDRPIYRNTPNGTIQEIIGIYTPSFENSASVLAQKYETIRIIGQRLGVTLEKTTPIFTNLAACSTSAPVPSPTPSGNFGGYTTLFQWTFKQAGAYLTQGPYMGPTHSRCDCYDFGVPMNTAIYPIAEGTVVFAREVTDNYRPWKIVIQTRFGRILYAHLNSCAVKEGQTVTLTTLIGRSGSCCDNVIGGPHLHLGLEGGIAASTGGQYSLTRILQEVGINLNTFGQRY